MSICSFVTPIKKRVYFKLKKKLNPLQVTILRMMDEENGVVHRRAKTKLVKKKSELRMLFQVESTDDVE